VLTLLVAVCILVLSDGVGFRTAFILLPSLFSHLLVNSDDNIHTLYMKNLNSNYIAELLKKFGFSFQKATLIYHNRDENERKIWLDKIWPSILKEAKNKNGLRTVGSEAENLPFPEASFDRITMVDALHHVGDQGQSLGELWRVLKPGGLLIVEEPDIHHFVVKLVALAEKLALMRSHFLSTDQISKLFGFKDAVVEVQNDGPIAFISV